MGCQDGTTSGGFPLNDGVCTYWCKDNLCGGSVVYRNEGADCSGCEKTTDLEWITTLPYNCEEILEKRYVQRTKRCTTTISHPSLESKCECERACEIEADECIGFGIFSTSNNFLCYTCTKN